MKQPNKLTRQLLSVTTFIIFLLANSITVAGQVNYGNNKHASKQVLLRNINFYLEEYGNGAPLILLHGNSGSIASMSPIIPALSKKYHVYAIDSRAHGKSVDDADSLSFKMMADDVSEIINRLKLDSVFVVGWSDGGIVALELAMRHPTQVRKMAITGANLWPDSTALEPWLWKEMRSYYDSTKSKIRETAKEKNEWKLFMLDWVLPQIRLSELQDIKCPVLVIAGDKDLIRTEHTVQIFQHIPLGNLWIVPNSSHGTLVEHPKEFSENIIKYFSGSLNRNK